MSEDRNKLVRANTTGIEPTSEVKPPKRANRSKSVRFDRVCLYLEEFYELAEVLKEECENVSIEADEYIIEDDRQIEKLNSRIHSLAMRGYNPGISVSLDQSSCIITATPKDGKTIGVFARLEEVVRRSASRTYLTPIMVSIVLASAICILGIAATAGKYRSGILAAHIAAMLLAVGCIIKDMNTARFQFYLEYKANKRNFFERKKDDIGLLVFGGIVGGLLTLLVQWLGKLLHIGS